MTNLIIPCWQTCYRPPALGEGRIHIWRFPRRPAMAPSARTLRLLSEEERARADRFLRPADRQAYIHCRGMLRRILGLYLGIPGSALNLDYGPAGKPGLYREGADFEFNLSHGGAFALLGVSRGIPLGIDLEPLRPRSHLLQLAQRVFDPDTYFRLSRLPPSRRILPFYLAWTGLEARVKAGGETLFAGLGETPGASYTLTHWLPAPGYCAALAYSNRREPVHLVFISPPLYQ